MNSAKTSPPVSDLIACHDCDLIHDPGHIAESSTALCSRCGAVLHRRPKDSLNRALALTLASVVLFVLANVYPFMYFKAQGQVEVNTMITGVLRLWQDGMQPLASVVFFASILAPGVKILLMLYLLVPLRFGRVPRFGARAFRAYSTLGPWGMLEVYMVGVLVAIPNLTSLASIVMGTACYVFVALMITTTAASAVMDRRLVWERLEAGA